MGTLTSQIDYNYFYIPSFLRSSSRHADQKDMYKCSQLYYK